MPYQDNILVSWRLYPFDFFLGWIKVDANLRSFEGFTLSNALFWLVSYNGTCRKGVRFPVFSFGKGPPEFDFLW